MNVNMCDKRCAWLLPPSHGWPPWHQRCRGLESWRSHGSGAPLSTTQRQRRHVVRPVLWTTTPTEVHGCCLPFMGEVDDLFRRGLDAWRRQERPGGVMGVELPWVPLSGMILLRNCWKRFHWGSPFHDQNRGKPVSWTEVLINVVFVLYRN